MSNSITKHNLSESLAVLLTVEVHDLLPPIGLYDGGSDILEHDVCPSQFGHVHYHAAHYVFRGKLELLGGRGWHLLRGLKLHSLGEKQHADECEESEHLIIIT